MTTKETKLEIEKLKLQLKIKELELELEKEKNKWGSWWTYEWPAYTDPHPSFTRPPVVTCETPHNITITNC